MWTKVGKYQENVGSLHALRMGGAARPRCMARDMGLRKRATSHLPFRSKYVLHILLNLASCSTCWEANITVAFSRQIRVPINQPLLESGDT
jgi:hypothetical protein